MPYKSTKQRDAMRLAAAGKSKLGIPKEVGQRFVQHERRTTKARPAPKSTKRSR